VVSEFGDSIDEDGYTYTSQWVSKDRLKFSVIPPKNPDPLDVQVDGDHYKKLKIQPIEYIMANELGFPEGSIVKYITRWRDKGGVKDLEKIKHFCDILIASTK
jgi:hypothetical protein